MASNTDAYRNRISDLELMVKINSAKMMNDRDYELYNEKFLLTESFEKIREYYNSKTHLITSEDEIRVYCNPPQLPKGCPLFLNPGEKLDASLSHEESSYINIHLFISNTINLEKSQDDYRNSLSNIYRHKKRREYHLVYVTASGTKSQSFGESEFRGITYICEICGISNLIIISKYKPTAAVKAKINEPKNLRKTSINENLRNIQIFEDKSFVNCLNEHTYFPKYQISSEHEFKIACGKNASSRSCSMMQVDDPASRYLGLKVGDIVKVEFELDLPCSFITREVFFCRVVPSVKEKKSKAR